MAAKPGNFDMKLADIAGQEEKSAQQEMKATDAAIGEGEQRLKKQDQAAADLANDKLPEMPKLPAAPDAPKDLPKLDPKKVFWATVVMGLLGAIMGGPGGAVAAMAGGIKGISQGRRELADQQFERWKEEMDRHATQVSDTLQQYDAVTRNYQLSHEQKLAKYQAIATANQDYISLQALRDKKFDVLDKIWTAREKAVTIIRNADPEAVGSSMWKAKLDSLRVKTGEYDNQKRELRSEQDRNIARIGVIQNNLRNQLSLTTDETEQTKVRKEAADEIQKLQAQNDKLDKDIDSISQKSVPAQSQLDRMMSVDTGFDVNPDIGQDMVQNGLNTGDVATKDGKFYRLEADGAHEISKDEYDKVAAPGGK